ncbi:MAG: NHL repeat-containing protein [bacterium]|nr:NHL repeat-containing protein [bacterium]
MRTKNRKIIILFFLLGLVSIVSSNLNSSSTYVYPPFKHTWGIVRATPAKLYMLLGNRVKFSNPLGLACVRLDTWENPQITADDDEVTVYGVNSGQNVIIYNKSMYELGVYGDQEVGDAKLNRPWGIAANRKGDVYVTDEGNHRVVHLKNPKADLRFYQSIGSKGYHTGEFNYPRGIALDNSGNFYVCDYANNRIQVFNQKNEYQYSIYDVYGPVGIAVIDKNEPWSYVYAHEREEFLVVLDSNESRISKFTLLGKLLKRLNAYEIQLEKVQWEFAAIDYYSQIHVTDRINHCIWKFDRNLNLLAKFGSYGINDGEFIEPRGIALYRRFGQIFIAEKEGAQYYWIGADVLNLTWQWNDKIRQLNIKGHLTEPSIVEVTLLDNKQKDLTTIAYRRLDAGKFELDWDGMVKKNLSLGITDIQNISVEKGDIISPVKRGNYTLRIQARATYSSNKDFVRTLLLPISIQ